MALAAHFASAGHEVTYLTQAHDADMRIDRAPTVRAIGVMPVMREYDGTGRRRISQPVSFALAVFRHLIRHRHSYDAVHLCSFPYFSLIACRLALAGTGAEIGVDWFEVWSASYWRDYLGRVGGPLGLAVQRLCIRLSPTAFLFSDAHGRRVLGELPLDRTVRLAGLYIDDGEPTTEAPQSGSYVYFAGRHVPEKGVLAIPETIARARARVPGLRAVIGGDGPLRAAVIDRVRYFGLEGEIDVPGYQDGSVVRAHMHCAAALLLPSRREGFGLVVVEAAAQGTPSIVIPHEDNAAVELIHPGENGVIAASGAPDDLADAIVEVIAAGAALRERTSAWWAHNRTLLSVETSADRLQRHYERRQTLGRARSARRHRRGPR